ncbi:MAG TPA: cyclic nucleotide-binding domain-containing protein [Spirochaetia bacterium]|nr:cyclic nucleotide-binding domain-containing protein [Spirochaetales bacterium]HRW24612.1 cyclic nucleotide-binding domain-containing protein [Spirochaetia bacterium]
MPKVGTYRANSVIYFQGDLGDKIFVLQRGRVTLNYNDIETGKLIREIIQTGEFFGVKSALGRYPREENAVVLEDANVLAFTVPEFEAFSMSNTRIIIKMLKVFSNQLRHIHKQVENLMENPSAVNAETGLFKTGEYYLRSRMYSQARYVFGRYLTYYPAGRMAEQAGRYLETAEAALARYGDGKGPAPLAVAQSASAQAGSAAAAPAAPPATAKPQEGASLSDVAKDYYNAVSLFSQEKYQEAMKILKVILETGSDSEYVGKAQFDMGRCLFALGQWDLAIKHFTGIVQSAPKHPDMSDILYIMGQSWEKKGDKARAKAFFAKVLSMPGDDDSSARIKAKKALGALGGA